MNTITASDNVTIDDAIETDDGFVVKSGKIARVGIQDYHASELGMTDADPMKVIRLMRPESEVFAPESMASFDGAPVTVDHPPELVSRSNWKDYAVGDVVSIRRDGNFLAGKIVLRDETAIRALKSGKRELSNGYTFTLDMTPGVDASGEAYDGLQRNIRGNHLALVDAARCGSACRVIDSQTMKEGTQPMTTRKVVVDGIPVEVSDTAAVTIEKLLKDRDDALKIAVDADAKHKADAAAAMDAKQAEIAAKDAEIAELKKDVIKPADRDAMIADWAKLIVDAKRLVPGLVTDGKTCMQIRREAIESSAKDNASAKAVASAVLAGKEVATADAELLRATFGAVCAAIGEKKESTNSNDSAIGAALLGGGQKTQIMDAHDLFIRNMTQGA